MKKVHCLNPIVKCDIDLFPADCELTKDAAGAGGILVCSAPIYDMDFPECLLAAGRAGTGVNNIPLDACVKAGTVVFSTPGANADGMEELVIADMLVASRDIVGGIEWCKANAEDDNITKDTEESKRTFAGCEIKGKKLGAVGLGAISAEVANIATHLGMKAYGYDPYISMSATWRLPRNVKHITNVDTIFQECDYITIHVPLLDSTKGTVNREKLAVVKDGVMILNFPRDTLVNDDDMAAVLEEGKIRYYISDFPNPEVANMKNVILISHLGASAQESKDNYAVTAIKEMTDYLENGNIKNSVSYPSRDMGIYQIESWVAVLYTNTLSIIGRVTGTLTGRGVNISDMISKSRDKYAYTLLDLEHKAKEATIEKLGATKGVLRVRVVR